MKPKWNRLNHQLIALLKQQNVLQSPHIEKAFRHTPRHTFAANTPLPDAYDNRVVNVLRDAEGTAISSLSQPAMIAIMLEQLDLRPGQTVLEIGAGTGYNAALMGHVVGTEGHVYTVDIEPEIVAAAQQNLDNAGVQNVTAIAADGADGYATQAPYDRIILTTSTWDIAPAWVAQLAETGRLVLPLIVAPGAQYSIAFDRYITDADDNQAPVALRSASHRACRFLTLRGSLQTPPFLRYKLDDGLFLENTTTPPPQPPELLHKWLQQRPQPQPTGVAIPDDLLFGLQFWLAMHLAPLVTLRLDERVPPALDLPPLLTRSSDPPAQFSPVFITADGLALLCRAGGDAPTDELLVAGYGEPDGVSRALATLQATVQSWQAAGTPTEQDARFWAFPGGTRLTLPAPGAQVHKPHSEIAVLWPAPA